MRSSADQITDMDLSAYVDGQLDEWQSARVEAWLALHPDQAAKVMQDIRLQRELRIALSGPASHGVQLATDRLARGLHRDAIIRRSLRFAPVAVMVTFGWLAWAGLLPISVGSVSAGSAHPEFVTAALAARDASEVRLPMTSMPDDPQLDTEELRAMTGILLPAFAPDWTIIDAQVFPSPQGPGIEIVFDTPDLGRVHHFAVRPGEFAVSLPETILSGDNPLSWFQIGATAHVLIAQRGDPDHLAAAADTLIDSLY